MATSLKTTCLMIQTCRNHPNQYVISIKSEDGHKLVLQDNKSCECESYRLKYWDDWMLVEMLKPEVLERLESIIKSIEQS